MKLFARKSSLSPTEFSQDSQWSVSRLKQMAPSTTQASRVSQRQTWITRSSQQKKPALSPGKVGLYVIILLVVAFYLFPLVYLINTALKAPGDFLSDPLSLVRQATLQNFSTAWVQANFSTEIVNSLLYAGIAAVISTLCSFLIAFPIARSYVRLSNWWYLLFVIALFLPNGLIPQFQLILHFNLYDTQIGYILLKAGDLGIGPFLLVGYLRSVPRELDEAAVIDGCGYFRFLWTMVFPLCKPALVTVFLLQAITVWNDIIGPTIYLANQSSYAVTQGLFSFFGEYGDQWTLIAAATLIVALPLIVLYIFLQRYFIEGALGGAFKS